MIASDQYLMFERGFAKPLIDVPWVISIYFYNLYLTEVVVTPLDLSIQKRRRHTLQRVNIAL
jgi:hypothetical protein